ncbi:hypothetical protein [Micromonospora sp. CP22]|uniref:hypothetical protein n=1 Tax=Micromonospora sp. CP22 TaxID=2580517 RepID=UPI0035C9271F
MRTLPTPCARDGKGPGHQHGLPDVVEPGGTRHHLLPTPTAQPYGSNRSPSAGAARRPSLAGVTGRLLPTPTAGGGTGYMSGTHRDTWKPTLESAVHGYRPHHGGKPPKSQAPPPSAAASGHSAMGIPGPLLPTPRASDTGTAGRRAGAGFRPPLSQVLLPTPKATDGTKGCPGQRGSHGDLTLPSAAVRVPGRTLPTPRASDARGPGRHGDGGTDLRTTVADLTGDLGHPDERRWGVYAAAVARWELLIGRPAPTPTQVGTHGKPVLAPPFVEWLMGLDERWVTDPALGLPRTAALRILGNGVVPQQAAAALRILLCPVRWEVST